MGYIPAQKTLHGAEAATQRSPAALAGIQEKKLPLTRNLRHSSARLGATDTDTGYGLHICKCQVSHLGDTCAFSLWGGRTCRRQTTNKHK